MNSDISTKTLYQSVRDVYEDGVMYFRRVSENASDQSRRTAADLAIREFQAGLEVMDLLVDQDADMFMTPEAAADVVRSIENLLQGLDQQRHPLLAWRAASLIEHAATCGAVACEEHATSSEPVPANATLH